MKFKNNTKENYSDLKECYEHTAVLKLKDGTYRVIHIQDGSDNLDEEDYNNDYTWYIDFGIKNFEKRPKKKDLFFEDEDDGGVLLCKDNFTEGHPTWESLIEEIAEMGDIEPDSIGSVELYYWER